MKYYSLIISIILLTVITEGCSSDFLDEIPTAHQSTSSYYKTESEAQRAILDVYRMTRDLAYGGYCPTAFGDMMSDDAAKGGGGASDQGEIQRLKLFVTKSNNGYVQNAWRDNYKGIYLANVVLAKIVQIDMDAKVKAQIRGEAHFLRGYFYLQLVRLFGSVPLIKESVDNGNYNLPQATSKEIWASIEEDADSAAMELLGKSELSHEQLGRATKGAAQSLLLEAYMWEKKWSLAQQLGDEIINSGEFSLDPDYQHIWTLDGEFGSGSIFEVNNENIPGKGVGNLLNLFEANRSTWGYGFNCPTQNLVDAFETGDPRLHATVIFNDEILSDGTKVNTTLSETGYYSKKYWLPEDQIPTNNGGGSGDGPTNDRLYRLAQIILWDAEASFHNNDIAHATELVNQIRERARNSGDNIDSSVLPPYSSVTLENIYQEQRVEFALGMHRRFYDLVRTGRAASILPNFKEGVNELLPIPLRELQLSGGVLKQNPGY